MSIPTNNTYELIRKLSLNLNLDDTVTVKATELYDEATAHPFFSSRRIADHNIAISSLYIANRLLATNPFDQNIFIYKTGISFATLRKTYKLICQALNIPRNQVVAPKYVPNSNNDPKQNNQPSP